MPTLTMHHVDNNLTQYAFAPKNPAHWGINVFALEAQGRVVLIDTGYAEHGKQLREELDRRKLRLDTVILSHFHDDHMEGSLWLEPPRLLGHANYQATLEKWTPQDEQQRYIPTEPIVSQTHWKFGSHALVLTPISGHSESDLLILVNETYLHIGDLILQDPQGAPILPAVEPPLLAAHMRALEELHLYLDYTFLLSHGQIIHDPAVKRREIDDRLRYLDALMTHPRGISYDDATSSCHQTYLHSEWHDGFYA